MKELNYNKVPFAPVKFHWTLWLWTNSEESLFALSPENLYVFKLLVQEARK